MMLDHREPGAGFSLSLAVLMHNAIHETSVGRVKARIMVRGDQSPRLPQFRLPIKASLALQAGAARRRDTAHISVRPPIMDLRKP